MESIGVDALCNIIVRLSTDDIAHVYQVSTTLASMCNSTTIVKQICWTKTMNHPLENERLAHTLYRLSVIHYNVITDFSNVNVYVNRQRDALMQYMLSELACLLYILSATRDGKKVYIQQSIQKQSGNDKPPILVQLSVIGSTPGIRVDACDVQWMIDTYKLIVPRSKHIESSRNKLHILVERPVLYNGKRAVADYDYSDLWVNSSYVFGIYGVRVTLDKAPSCVYPLDERLITCI